MGYQWLKIIRSGIEKKIHKLEPKAFLDSSKFPWVTEIEKEYSEIRKEAELVLKQTENIIDFDSVLPNQRALYQGGLWKSFFLLAMEKDVPKHQQICSNTTKALKKIPGVINAFFSILKPGVHIPPHRGPYAGIIRYHLGIIIPEGDVAIKVNGEKYYWKEGKSLFFDDSFEHEAWNNTNSIRLILFVDLKRPLPGILSALNKLILAAFRMTRIAKTGYKTIIENQLVY